MTFFILKGSLLPALLLVQILLQALPYSRSFLTNERHCARTSRGAPSNILKASSTADDHGNDVDGSTIPSPKTREIVEQFASAVQQTLQDESFVSLRLRGVKKSKDEDATNYRGSIRQVQGRLIAMPKTQETTVQLTFKYHGATDIAKNIPPNEIYQALSKIILNPSLLPSEWGAEAAAKSIQGGELQTLHNIYDMQLLSTKKPKLKKRPQKKQTVPTADVNAQQSLSHDRKKQVPLESDAQFFNVLGVTKADGKPRPGMKGKLRQCQKFVEIVGALVFKLAVPDGDNNDNHDHGDSATNISVVDMGCGRGYLTFALHYYLQSKYFSVHSRGIDVRPKLMTEVSAIAQTLGSSFSTLSFEVGTIEDFLQELKAKQIRSDSPATKIVSNLDIVIALHACDTATDDALWSGISQNSDLLVVAPCCHKEVRSQVDPHFRSNKDTHPMADILRHGVYRERMSETVTDSLRGLLLEWAGYKAQVFEFIGGEHTSKNVMITAVKSNKPPSESEKAKTEERINALAELYGVRSQKLAGLMGFQFRNQSPSRKKDRRYMPSL